MPKISDALKERLEAEKVRKQTLMDDLTAIKTKMENLRRMMTDEVQRQMSSSSHAAKKNRGKEVSSMSMVDEEEALDLAVRQKEEELKRCEEKLREYQLLFEK